MSKPWTAHGSAVWHHSRDCDICVADCDTEEHATLIATAPELLALAQELTKELQEDRDAIFKSNTVGDDESTADPQDLAWFVSLDQKIAKAQTVINKAMGA